MKTKNRNIIFLTSILLIVLSMAFTTGITPVSAKPQQTTDILTKMQSADVVAVYDGNADQDINVDGVIGASEYGESFYDPFILSTISMVHNGTHMFVALEAETAGWVAVGFNDEGIGMVGADIKMGYYNGITNKASASDRYAIYYTQPINDDHDDILKYNLTESIGSVNKTTFEFVIPLNQSDSNAYNSNYKVYQDKSLQVNHTYSLLIAWALTDSIGVQHFKNKEFKLFVAPDFVTSRQDTSVTLDLGDTSSASQSTVFSATVQLNDVASSGIANQSVGVYMTTLLGELELNSSTTDSTGKAVFTFMVDQQYVGQIELYAKYLGDFTHKQSKSSSSMVPFTGVEDSYVALEPQWQVIPAEFNWLVPYIAGFGGLFTLIFLWCSFAYVVYTVLYLNAKEPSKSKKERGE